MNYEEFKQLKVEAKMDFLGEQLTQEVYRLLRLIHLVENINERVESLEARYETGNKGKLFEMRNELTYLHNEVREISNHLGLHGEIPKIKPKRKSRYD